MATKQGNAHKIATMASKSCNGVSARDLYIPLVTTITTNTTNRTYRVVVDAYCFFDTRININNTFHNMTLNGQSVNDKTVNGWVSQDLPGTKIATTTITGSYDAEGKPSTASYNISITGSMTYYKDVGCHATAEREFANSIIANIPNIAPRYVPPATPTYDVAYNLPDAIELNLAVDNFGEGGGKYLYAEASKTSDFAKVKRSNVLNTEAGLVRISNLQQNTLYHVRVVAANNGSETVVVDSSNNMFTISSGEIISLQPGGTSGFTAKVFVNTGSNYFPNNTEWLERSSDGGATWTECSTSRAHISGTGTILGTVLQGSENNLVRLVVQTVGPEIFYSEPVEYTAPTDIWGYITDITPMSGTQANVRFRVFGDSGTGPATVKVWYRPYGMEEDWIDGGSTTATPGFMYADVLLNNLIANYAKYEVSLEITRTGTSGYNTEPITFFTIPTVVSNDTCESLDYMVQLICQIYKAIKEGNIVIYMNDDTKQWCEGEDGIPTLAAIMSRVDRFMHAVGCTLCSMEGFIELLKASEPNQVFMAQAGWVDCDDTPTEGSVRPVTSDGVKQAVDDLVSQVWHFIDSYDYYGTDLADLQSQTPPSSGRTGIVDNHRYHWNGSSWVDDGVAPEISNFGVIHINGGKYAEEAYYWFVDDWNRLDADTEAIERRLEALESLKLVESLDPGQYKIATADGTKTAAQVSALIPTDATMDTIILLTDPEQQDETTVTVLPS